MLRTYVLLVSALLTSSAAALDGKTRPVSPDLDWNAAALQRFDAAWLHLKFVEGSDVELVVAPTVSGQHFASADGGDLLDVNRVLAGAVTMRRTFPGDREKFRAWKARGEAGSGQPGPDLSLWYDVELARDRATLADTLNALNALSAIEIAHPAPICEPAVVISAAPVSQLANAWPGVDGFTPDFTDLQVYLYDTPVGLDAPSAWAVPGGRGAGMKFIDVEPGWTHMHEDFDHEAQFYQGEHNSGSSSFRNHGTAVMGEVVGVNNSFGITGFASEAQWGTVGILLNEWPTVPHRFMEAVEALDPGDVWLIELQMLGPGGVVPMEWLQVNYDVIWTSSWALNVVCIEAGANGSLDLDAEVFGGAFDRDVRDSGAIMVAAGTPTGRTAEWFTNYGSRMDVHAWGSEIVTTGYGDLHDEGPPETEYTARFGGTSGASPMAAGSALCVQGIAVGSLGSPLTPIALRNLLHETGIDHLGSKLIGPRPDLGAAVEQLLNRRVADLTDVVVVDGTLIDGGLEELVQSDDQRLHAKARVTAEVSRPHLLTLDVDAAISGGSVREMEITFEGAISDVEAAVSLALRDWQTNELVQVGQFTNGMAETVNVVHVPDAFRFVREGDGRIELRVTEIVFFPSTLGTFHSFIDQIEFVAR